MKIDECRNINDMKKVLKEQGIFVYDASLAKCATFAEMIKVCKICGAK